MGLLDDFFDMLGTSDESPSYFRSRASGLMYPEDRSELGALLKNLLEGGDGDISGQQGPTKGLVVPQSEYEFSGEIAAEAFRHWAHGPDIERVIVIGSSRMIPFQGLAVSRKSGIETSFGRIEFDEEWINRVVERDDVRILEEAFESDLTIDVQLPFLQYILDDFRLVPVLVGDVKPGSIADVLDELWGDESTRFVLSANLSEGYSPEKATSLDRETVEAIQALESGRLSREHSLSRNALEGFIRVCRRNELEPEVLSTSTSESKLDQEIVEKVAGYGAFRFKS